MLLPKAIDHRDYQSYFKALIALNKAKKRYFSHRYFARRIKWPPSYLSDLVNGHKSLTLVRALQFAKAVDMDPFDTERMVFWSLRENDDHNVKRFAESNLESDVMGNILKNPIIQGKDPSCLDDTKICFIFESIAVLAVLTVLVWARRLLPPEEIKDLLFSFHGISPNEVRRIINTLVSKGIVVANGNGDIVKTDFNAYRMLLEAQGDMERIGRDIHTQFAHNFMRYLYYNHGPRICGSGFIVVPEESVEGIRSKFVQLQLLLENINSQAGSSSSYNSGSHRVFQYDINFFPIVAKVARL